MISELLVLLASLSFFIQLVTPLLWKPQLSIPPSTITMEPSNHLTIPPDPGFSLKPPSCSFTLMDNFIRITCRNSTGHLVIRCHGSDEYYTYRLWREFEDYYGKVCTGDPNFYQACPGDFRKVNTTGKLPAGPFRFLCGNNAYICATSNNELSSGDLVELLYGCDGYESCQNTQVDEAMCWGDTSFDRVYECVYWKVGLFKGQICDGECDCPDCDDEAECNGYQYGMYCMYGFNNFFDWRFCYPERICDGISWCEDLRDEVGCSAQVVGTRPPPVGTIPPPLRPSPDFLYDYVVKEYVRVANISRCFPRLQYRFGLLDQTNCSDPTVVMIWCPVGGYNTSVSKYVVCTAARTDNNNNHGPEEPHSPTTGICDSGIDRECVGLAVGCYLHKHLLCDGIRQCPGSEDEINGVCRMQSYRRCVRVTGGPSQQLPLAWIMDGVVDCRDGSDEEPGLWNTCGRGPYQRIHPDSNLYQGSVHHEDKTCTDVLICPGCPVGFVEMTENLCQGHTPCRIVRDMCQASRSQLQIRSTVVRVTRDDDGIGGRRAALLGTCQLGISSRDLHVTCSTQFFPQAGYILGVQRPLLVLPQNPVDCRYVFGEAYLYLSCTDRCHMATCPLPTAILKYDECPVTVNPSRRAFTLVDNQKLTMVGQIARGTFTLKELFPCGNGRCVPYAFVCDLTDDCDNGSDEHNCTNHFRCGSGERLPLFQVCDGVIDCHDISDECNETCSARIIPNLGLLIWGCLLGLGTALLNGYMFLRNVVELRNLSSRESITNKVWIVVISVGDLLTGTYLALLTLADISYGRGFCRSQNRWLAGTACWVAGVLSTIANQLSLLSMTVLSVIRVRNLRAGFTKSVVTPLFGVTTGLIVSLVVGCAVTIAVIPVLSVFEENFLNGIYYTNMPLFAGIPDKTAHIAVLERYYGRIRSRDLMTWRTILKLMEEMVSQDYGGLKYTRHSFYGNSPVCMFKFFVTLQDPQSTYVWTVILLNSICFIVISASYVSIYLVSRASSQSLATGPNRKLINSRNKALQKKISLIIGTDLLTWMPFTVVCILHLLEVINAGPLYAVFSMVVIPINSFINPLLYTDNVVKKGVMVMVSVVKRGVVRLGNYVERGQGNRQRNAE